MLDAAGRRDKPHHPSAQEEDNGGKDEDNGGRDDEPQGKWDFKIRGKNLHTDWTGKKTHTNGQRNHRSRKWASLVVLTHSTHTLPQLNVRTKLCWDASQKMNSELAVMTLRYALVGCSTL